MGLGGGGIAKIVRKNWPNVKITGVDIDPVIVDLGKKYLGLRETETEIIIKDAYEYCAKCKILNTKYDLICVDIYVGNEVPEKFQKEDFLELVLKLLDPEGIAVFNRLYYDEKRKIARDFERKLEKVFSEVTPVYPQANVLFVCKS